MSAVRLFSGASFISAEITDILFEVKVVLCFYFYALGDVFRRNGTVQQNRIANNRFELERTIPKNKNTILDISGRKNLVVTQKRSKKYYFCFENATVLCYSKKDQSEKG